MADTRLGGEHGDPGVLGTGIDAESDPVDLWCFDAAALGSDDERRVMVRYRAPFGQEPACPSRRAGLEGMAVPVEDEHGRMNGSDGVDLTVLLPGPGGLGGDAAGSRCTACGLPSHRFHAGYRNAVFEPRFVRDPSVVHWLEFESTDENCAAGVRWGWWRATGGMRKHNVVGLLSCVKRSHQGHLPVADGWCW